ncbi:hypothetical protein M422DRAFT_26607 [Sphaerobolus stellatus SS14]|nr:hypothetical protein M422DRAFT_26607 [Sphaerobolus stellatus SS14]
MFDLSVDLLEKLPWEIVRLILEWAATSPPTSLTLSLVSKTVFQWSIPVSYRTVVLREPQDSLSLEAALTSPDLGRQLHYCSSVRNISLPRHGVAPISILKCPNLRHVGVYAYDLMARFALTLNHPNLTHLVIYDQSLYFHLQTPLTSCVTHLLVSQQFMLRNPNLSDLIFPNITHFVTPVLTNGGRSCENAYKASFSQLLELPKLQVVGLMVFRVESPSRQAVPDSNMDSYAVRKMVGVEDDPRVASFPRQFVVDGEAWRATCDAQEDIWEKAERFLNKKGKTKASLIHWKNNL